jgi:hypothetical protein
MRTICLLFILNLAFVIKAQDTIIGSGTQPWSHLNFNNNPDNFQFAIMADRTGGHRQGILEDAIKKLNLLQPEFVISIGDMIEGYTLNEPEIRQQWTIYNSFIEKLDMPFFYIPGNHDYTNQAMSGIWEELYGPSYYHFIYKNVLFLCLNSEESPAGEGMGGIDEQQFNYVKEILAGYPDVRWTIVLMHRPLWLDKENGYWNEIESLLSTRNHTVFAGHSHHYVKYERNNGKYIILSTAGGISELRGPDFGEFDQIPLVTMSEEGPVLANLLLQGIWDENVVTQELYEMISSKNIMIEPVFVNEDEFTKTEFRIMVSNEYNYPMWVYLTFDENPLLKPEIVSYQKEILPNSLDIIKLPVNTLTPVGMKLIQPLILNAWLVYKYENNRQINVDSKFGIAPVKKEYCNFTNGRIWIDGVIDEWEGLSFRTDTRSPKSGDINEYYGDFDGSFEFDVKYDHENLYIALSVWDDQLILDEKWSPWTQDVIRIYLDGRPLEISSNGRGENQSDDFLCISFAAAEGKKANANIYQKQLLPRNTTIAAKKTVAGFDAEISIPLSYLDFKNGADWENFRINIAFVDCDENSSRTIIWWKPAWDSPENYIGSGMFFKKQE